jgi:hypothetical protein
MPMRGLTAAVLVMGLMIVAGVTAIVAMTVHRMASPAASRPFVAAPLELPVGSRIETIGVSADRAVLALVLPDGSRQLLVIDLASGRRLGAIPLQTAP